MEAGAGSGTGEGAAPTPSDETPSEAKGGNEAPSSGATGGGDGRGEGGKPRMGKETEMKEDGKNYHLCHLHHHPCWCRNRGSRRDKGAEVVKAVQTRLGMEVEFVSGCRILRLITLNSLL